MAKPTLDASGVIEVLNRLYQEILDIEEPLGLIFGRGDLRPRIEYFHDAVRAMVSGEPRSRLRLEMLAYDVAMLRYIHTRPMGQLHPAPPRREIIENDAKPQNAGIDERTAKTRLADLYQQYGVLFSALFRPEADNDYRERAGQLNEAVEQLAAVMHLIESNALPRDIRSAMAQIDDAQVRQSLQDKKGELRQSVKKANNKADADLAQLDKTHLQYGSAQLGLFEDGRDIVKKLAASGMNLAGQFVANAMAQAQRGMGRQ